MSTRTLLTTCIDVARNHSDDVVAIQLHDTESPCQYAVSLARKIIVPSLMIRDPYLLANAVSKLLFERCTEDDVASPRRYVLISPAKNTKGYAITLAYGFYDEPAALRFAHQYSKGRYANLKTFEWINLE